MLPSTPRNPDTHTSIVRRFGTGASSPGGCGACTTEHSRAPLQGDGPVTVLWIDDEIRPDDATVRLLTLQGFRVDCADSGRAGLTKAAGHVFDAVILDLRLGDLYGLSVLERLRRISGTPVLVLTGWYGEDESEAAARALGAWGFYRKPVSCEELSSAISAMVSREQMAGFSRGATRRIDATAASHADMQGGESSALHLDGLVACGRRMRAVVDWIEQVARSDIPVLLSGETGTGKELVSRTLHARSRRSQGPFVPVNCGAIPEGLLETELFGHRRGAFTGALQDKRGLLEAAEGGTLFLDEIADMPPQTQVRLLRFLEDGEVRRLGDTRSRTLDVRVIAAANRPLAEEVAKRRFRQDLYFRLAVARYHLPPLRERLEDLEPLVEHWLSKVAHAGGAARRTLGITPEAIATLRSYSWPGNIRELRSVLEYSVCLAAGRYVTDEEVRAALSGTPPSVDHRNSAAPEEARQTLSALEANRWNRTRTARALGISRSTLWRRLRGCGVER